MRIGGYEWVFHEILLVMFVEDEVAIHQGGSHLPARCPTKPGLLSRGRWLTGNLVEAGRRATDKR